MLVCATNFLATSSTTRSFQTVTQPRLDFAESWEVHLKQDYWAAFRSYSECWADSITRRLLNAAKATRELPPKMDCKWPLALWSKQTSQRNGVDGITPRLGRLRPPRHPHLSTFQFYGIGCYPGRVPVETDRTRRDRSYLRQSPVAVGDKVVPSEAKLRRCRRGASHASSRSSSPVR